ncbi:MAG: TIGR03013 family PEP-CTERM/XrtA system glycosyltransferase [Acidobacteria bacterium]|nr:TIGR03013 family PEP-CTERM/XrtA system glycosyltransferase [Acidobacteriota bacterium]
MLSFLSLRKFGTVVLEYAMLAGLILYVWLVSLQDSVAQPPHVGLIAFKALCIAMIFQIFLHLSDARDYRRTRRLSASMMRVAKALLLASLTLWASCLLFPHLLVGHETLARILVASSVFLVAWYALVRCYFHSRVPRSNIVLLGTGRLARELVREILRRPELGIGVSGFLGDDPALVGVSIVNPKVIGLYGELQRIVSTEKVDRVVVELENRRGQLPIDALLKLKTQNIRVEEAASLYERVTGKIAVENLKPSWMIFNPGFELSRRHARAARILSVLLSLTALLILSPVILPVMILIRLDSPGPVFFRQERVGRNGKPFILWKFRSMCMHAERETGPVWAKRNDPRVTRLGRFLRRSRLDEVPQLYNVLHGDMSLIGPRPERPGFVKELCATTPYYKIRHAVMPGLTGWAQINYAYANSIEDSVEKLQYDLFYVKHRSIALDLIIAFETIKTILVRPGS